MRRQENNYIYTSAEYVRLTISGKNTYNITFDSIAYDDVRIYKWSHRGKGIFINEFGETIGAFLAEIYGYEPGTWTRKTADLDYTSSNFVHKDEAVYEVPERVSAASKPYDDMGVANLSRLKYRTKYECVDLQVVTVNPSQPTVIIKINKFAAQYVPSKLRIIEGEPHCLDGRALKNHILNMVNAEYDHIKYISYTKLCDPYDLRLDPNDLTYVNRNVDRTRFHFFTDEEAEEPELCVVEFQENTRSGARFFWQPANTEQKWRMPMWHTQFQPRVSYCVINADLAERIDDIYWDDKAGDWYMRDIDKGVVDERTGLIKPEQVKRVVAKSAGHQLENIYFPPRHTQRYQQALEAGFDVTSKEGLRAARRRARYENKIDSGDKRGGMFTKPKYLKRKKVEANGTYFCTAIYGGVGIWCADLRRESVYIPGYQSPDKDYSKRKDA